MMKAGDKFFDITVIGGGIVGLSTAYKLSVYHPDLSIAVLEKEESVAAHQTSHNSGVIHSGLYYKPGSYKAKNCVEGRRELVAFAREHNIPHDICGKIVVATREAELPFLNKIYQNGIQNGVEDVTKITAQQITDIEPLCFGIAGIHVGCTGIIDFGAVARKLVDLIEKGGNQNKVFKGIEALSFTRHDDGSVIHTNQGMVNSRFIIACAGLQSDRVAIKDGVETDARIVGFRGDYYDLTEEAVHKIKNLIYPVPDPAFPFLGVHFTRMIHGGVECGPNAVFVFKREGYGKSDFDLKDTWDALTFGGTWKLFRKHWRFGLDEYRRAFSKKLFLNRLQRLVPSLVMDDLQTGRSGVRAMALGSDGEMIDDFKIEHHGNALHVLNAPSPAATASLAIGSAVTQMAEKHFGLI
jgi:(S)-2-hydroxyglutarate dehydrogenase